MPVRGIRGATVVSANSEEAILSATRELLVAILDANSTLLSKDIASALFTVSDDLSAAYPAKAARQLGWTETPLMCAREIPVQASLSLCIRVLLHWNTDLPQSEINHVYLREAAKLRSDLSPRRHGEH
ncbi:MAG: chorismate mutase [Anaerolineales bacterium]|nr:chorismate mutase [Anaerolineales bacterium]